MPRLGMVPIDHSKGATSISRLGFWAVSSIGMFAFSIHHLGLPPPNWLDQCLRTQAISSLTADATDTETLGTNQIFAKPTFELKRI